MKISVRPLSPSTTALLNLISVVVYIGGVGRMSLSQGQRCWCYIINFVQAQNIEAWLCVTVYHRTEQEIAHVRGGLQAVCLVIG